MTKPLVIYHGNCADGFTAAWLFNIYWHDMNSLHVGHPGDWVVDHHAGVYGETPPDVTGRDVYILDFSYPPEQLAPMAELAHSITVIDHHESAIRKLDGFSHPRVKLYLDTQRSGAYLTSLWCWPDRDPWEMVRLVDDRDRWQFHLPDSRPFAAGLFSRSYTIGEWNDANRNIAGTVADGIAIERKHHKDIEELLAQTAHVVNYGDMEVAIANMSYMHASDAGHKMLDMFPHVAFAATFFLDKDELMVFSLRSDESKPWRQNVAQIAERFGGGGHRNAAGFKVTSYPFA